jgi:excisionase family DNA binding protein
MSKTFLIGDVSKQLVVSDKTVRGWITAGELRAINVARKRGAKKARWRITQEALDAFLAARTPGPAAPKTRRKTASDVVSFY